VTFNEWVTMNGVTRDLILWELVSRVHVTSWYAVASLVAPRSSFLSPHLSVTAILFAIVYGLLISLLHWLGGTPRSHQRKGAIGIVYVLLAAVPFILAQFVFSWMGWHLLPTILVALLAPVLLTAVSFRQAPMHDPGLSFLTTLFHSHRLLYNALAMGNSLITGYGLPFLSFYLYAWLTNQIFGHLTLANLGMLLLSGGMIAGLLYGASLRVPRRMH
jgi:hypothetical protein